MSVNKHKPHVFVLPEDDANRQLANGFWQEIDWDRQGQMFVLPVADGWTEVLNLFNTEHVSSMNVWQTRFMVLLIDFDDDEDRLERVKTSIPQHLAPRVFVLGTLSEPEDLRRQNLGSYETIGMGMAKDCRDETETTWGHALLRHNTAELNRLRESVRPILFPDV